MKRLVIVSLVSLCWLLALNVRPVAAQIYPGSAARPSFSPYGAYNQPTLSPYLNLLRGGNQAINYFGLTLPEVQGRANAVQFRSAIQDLEQRTQQPAPTADDLFKPLTSTGHPTAFGNLGGYFGPATQPGAVRPGGGTPIPRR
jgi:hypothetical protein